MFRNILQRLPQFLGWARREMKQLGGRIHRLSHVDPWLAIVIFVSFFTTWTGASAVYGVMGSGEGSWLSTFLRLTIPLAGAGAIHVLIYNLLSQWRRSQLSKYFWAALPFQAIAVLLSVNSHWIAMRGASETMSTYAAGQAATVRGLISYGQSNRFVADAMTRLAEHSEAQRDNEVNGPANSCGYSAGQGAWVRHDLRVSDMQSFAAFKERVEARQSRLDEIVARAEGLVARSADDAMQNVPALTRITNEASAFATDPLLAQLRGAAEARIALGSGPIPIPEARRRASGETTFLCPDPTLDMHLKSVVAAIDGVEELPEVKVADARQAQVALALFLPRLANSVMALPQSLLGTAIPPTRAELVRNRMASGSEPVPASEGLRREDVPPLMFAVAMEAILIALFRYGKDSLPMHPGLVRMDEIDGRRSGRRIARLWSLVGGDASSGALRKLLREWSKFDEKGVLVFVPVNGTDSVESLFDLMELMVQSGLARSVYTGAGLTLRLYTQGMAPASRKRIQDAAPVRAYRMTNEAFQAMILDLAGAEAEATPH
jgi:hypothetical protein